MLTSTIVLSGKLIVDDALFSWWVTDGSAPRLTVSHPVHGTEHQPLASSELAGDKPRAQARTMAEAMLASTPRPAPSIARGQ